MLVNECMTRDVKLVSPGETIQDAARIMAEIDAGVLPVTDGDRLIGVITDRDIAIRAIAKGLGPETPVKSVMSREVLYCFDDEEIDEVADNMANIQVRRLPVVDRDKRLVGIISLGDIALTDERTAGEAIAGIAEPGGRHTQSGDGSTVHGGG